jgi:hypothetical protein
MSIEATMTRISELRTAFAPPVQPAPAPSAATFAPGTSTAGSNFASLLGAQSASPLGAMPTGGPAAQGILAAITPEVGVAEQPPGSNDSPRIAEYRAATEGSPGPGPWCAYFVSWAARQAGTPLGDHGQGFGSVDAVYAWAQSAGKAIPAGSAPPQPGDLVVWDEHIGVVEGVRPDGSIQTIEGNSSDRVSRRVHAKGDAIGYVRLSN